jgi:dTDP-glucose pyrophosphorylase
MQTIILCGGKIDYTHLPVSTNTSNAMIPVNGKPVISWILDDLISKGILDAIVVHRAADIHLREFLNRAYKIRMQLTLVELRESKSILHSIEAGLALVSGDEGVRIVLGDTLIRDAFNHPEDLIYVHEVRDSERWCLAIFNNEQQVEGYIDKQPRAPMPHWAVCGYYQLRDLQLAKQAINSCIQDGRKQVSEMLARYQQSRPIKAMKAELWYDFGNIDNLILSRQKLLQSRFFNSLSVDGVLNTITKVSEMDEKLRLELRWYEDIPDRLKVLTPRIISKEVRDGKLHLTQEYYGYPTLAELYLFSDLSVETWFSILRKLIVLHQEFTSFKTQLDVNDSRTMYLTKTSERLAAFRKLHPRWNELLSSDYIILNGERLGNLPLIMNAVEERIDELLTTEGSIIHGDYCFSNILYDYNNQIVRLIDPRGSFGKPGIYGDPRYDMAKLRHSISGLYDYIVSDLFRITEEGATFNVDLYCNRVPSTITPFFDTLLEESGYKPKEVQFIEALLFVSMLPLHQENPQRQKMMYLTGIKILNQIL